MAAITTSTSAWSRLSRRPDSGRDQVAAVRGGRTRLAETAELHYPIEGRLGTS